MTDGECLRMGKLEQGDLDAGTPRTTCFTKKLKQLMFTGDHITHVSPNVSLHPQSDDDPWVITCAPEEAARAQDEEGPASA
jgi:hypothetical protein